jgi:thiosulfate reductase cytochrome b subunit
MGIHESLLPGWLLLALVLLHLLLHLAHFLLHSLAGPVNRNDKFKHQFVQHIQQKQLEEQFKNIHGTKILSVKNILMLIF